jgi:hypothetical protein
MVGNAAGEPKANAAAFEKSDGVVRVFNEGIEIRFADLVASEKTHIGDYFVAAVVIPGCTLQMIVPDPDEPRRLGRAAAELVVLFQQENTQALFVRGERGREPGNPAAEHDNIIGALRTAQRFPLVNGAFDVPLSFDKRSSGESTPGEHDTPTWNAMLAGRRRRKSQKS